MRYQHFWRRNRHWPRRIPSTKGRYVCLAQEIRTRSGLRFGEGELMRVAYACAGYLYLKPVATEEGFLARICPTRVHLLPADFKPTAAERRMY